MGTLAYDGLVHVVHAAGWYMHCDGDLFNAIVYSGEICFMPSIVVTCMRCYATEIGNPTWPRT